MTEKFLAHAPGDEEAGGVGEDLNACADFANGGGGLEDGDRVAGEGERDGGSEATEASTHDDDLRYVSLELWEFGREKTFSWTGDLLIVAAMW